jgi:hypothetical protein
LGAPQPAVSQPVLLLAMLQPVVLQPVVLQLALLQPVVLRLIPRQPNVPHETQLLYENSSLNVYVYDCAYVRVISTSQ